MDAWTHDASSIVSDYLSITNEMRLKFGELTIVFMQVGHFFECYDICEDSPHIQVCRHILNLTIGRKSNMQCSGKTPYMAGVPVAGDSFMKNVKLLLHHGYTIVKIVQEEFECPTFSNEKSRRIECIYSPGCVISDDDTTASVLICAVFVETDTGAQVCCSKLDANIGSVEYVALVLSSLNEGVKWFNDLLYEIGTCNELNVFFKGEHFDEFQKMCHFNILSQRFEHLHENRSFIFHREFQKKLLEQIYPKHNLLGGSIFMHLNMETLDANEIASLVLLLLFVREHDVNIVSSLSPPQLFHNTHNDSVQCLNSLFERVDMFTDKGMYSLLCNQRTKMGQRLLRKLLRLPTTNIATLKERYEMIEYFMQLSDEVKTKIQKCLHKIADLDRLHRILVVDKASPMDIVRLYTSYESMLELSDVISFHHDTLLQEAKDFIESSFNLSSCAKHTAGMNRDVFDELKALYGRELYLAQRLKAIVRFFDSILNNTFSDKKECIKLVQSTQGEYSIQTTPKRAKIIENKLRFAETFQIDGEEVSHFTVLYVNKYAILQGSFHELLTEYSGIQSEIQACEKKQFQTTCLQLAYLTDRIAISSSEYVANIDLFFGMAAHAQQHGYVRPEFVDEIGVIRATEVRHPIIEKIVTREGKSFVPNDVELGPLHSWLLYGVNSAGKSSLLKSIILNVLLAQCGFFVAAKTFAYYPFRYLGCRIGNADNIFVGQSSYIRELIEMKTILNRVRGPPALIITDEMCSSTESESSIRVMASFIQLLAERRVSFANATHFYELQDNNFINGLTTLKNKHLKVRFENGSVIFDRTLHEGLPESRKYGVRIADVMITDSRFRSLLKSDWHQPSNVMSMLDQVSTSTYNRKSLRDCCQICGYKPIKITDNRLQTHHIQFQCTADAFGNIEHGIHKHSLCNLVTVCQQCHISIHNDKIIIHGYEDTMNGQILKFEFV